MEQDVDEGPTERRQSNRRRMLKRALIVFQGGHCTIKCHILNMSETGALLAPIDVMLCPSEFILKPDFGEPRTCEVVRRKGSTLAVHFV